MKVKQQLENVRHRIVKAAERCGRDPDDIRLVAVTKTIPADKVKEAIRCGADILGENYVQEAREKVSALSAFKVAWHFIGHLQTNKAKYAVPIFDLIHSVDSYKLAKELDRQAKKIDKTQDILIQVNIAGEASKSGVSQVNVQDLINDISGLENVSIKGLMTMPPYFNDPERVRPHFRALRKLRDRIGSLAIANVSMAELSMGMTGDFEAAIEEGATLVRVGTAIFGERQ